ncbi:Flavin-containing monooxygenase FMO GS-OX-like [Seminavis robusta]|uniref:Flavin-containing monooxygenase FMO GS-OX-like n=1 Tax=Seminavis robusta TaxID=568900 RepID=A0A9N8E357_9STRA|nr:Flavin-containing monooxygenase FMO GS-OX-like [Seminavis robusta]|eukprot:Sro479_g151120.1 Flavin-containing monooxygenase FMO GS-OX-like (474) ;mRNA; r:6717-8249
MSSVSPMAPKVAIIGAGSSGLAAAQVFSRHGMEPVVLEQESQSGGVWCYQTKQQANTKKTKPMYRGLRTNLPKEIMQFREFPWKMPLDRSFVTHQQVQEYLLEYQTQFGLDKFIRYGCQVSQLQVLKDSKSALSPTTSSEEDWPQIRLAWKHNNNNEEESEIFDAVCICNGHYSKPAFPPLQGLHEYYQGRILHSVEYDNPADFVGQRVLCIGGRASGSDLAREIGAHAQHVYLSDSTCTLSDGTPETLDNITWVPLTVGIQEDGTAQFQNCNTLFPTVDCIIFCTGYDYDFPFLNNNNDNNDDEPVQCVPGERRVMPLYEQLWHARYPTVSFLGIPHSVVPFPEVEFQAEAVHAQYTVHNNQLPPLEERLQAAERDAVSGGAKGPQNGRIQDTHYLGAQQWDYCRQMAKLAGVYDQSVEDYIATNQMIYDHSTNNRKGAFPAGPDDYREVRYTRKESGAGFTFDAKDTVGTA